jgi:hypothetical protein
VTPPVQDFADVLNQMARDGCAPWAVNAPQSVFGKTFAPFGLAAGRNFMEYDLVYLSHGLAVLGRPPRRRPQHRQRSEPADDQQIPLARS